MTDRLQSGLAAVLLLVAAGCLIPVDTDPLDAFITNGSNETVIVRVDDGPWISVPTNLSGAFYSEYADGTNELEDGVVGRVTVVDSQCRLLPLPRTYGCHCLSWFRGI